MYGYGGAFQQLVIAIYPCGLWSTIVMLLLYSAHQAIGLACSMATLIYSPIILQHDETASMTVKVACIG